MSSERKTLNVSQEAYDRLTDALEPLEDESATEYVRRIAENLDESDGHTGVTSHDTGDVTLGDIETRLRSLEEQVEKNPERTADELEDRFR